MPLLSIYIDDRTQTILERVSATSGKSVEQIAAEAVESDAITHLPGGLPHMHFSEGQVQTHYRRYDERRRSGDYHGG